MRNEKCESTRQRIWLRCYSLPCLALPCLALPPEDSLPFSAPPSLDLLSLHTSLHTSLCSPPPLTYRKDMFISASGDWTLRLWKEGHKNSLLLFQSSNHEVGCSDVYNSDCGPVTCDHPHHICLNLSHVISLIISDYTCPMWSPSSYLLKPVTCDHPLIIYLLEPGRWMTSSGARPMRQFLVTWLLEDDWRWVSAQQEKHPFKRHITSL